MKCRIIYSVRRRRAQIKRLPASCVKSIARSTNGTERAKETLILPILIWMRTCERAADVIYFSLYKHPAAEDKFHSSSFLLMHLLWRGACAKKKCVSFDACSVAWLKRKTDGTHFRKKKRRIPDAHRYLSLSFVKEYTLSLNKAHKFIKNYQWESFQVQQKNCE
jgi:hypothetical protein